VYEQANTQKLDISEFVYCEFSVYMINIIFYKN